MGGGRGVRGRERDKESPIKAALFQEHLCEEEKGNLAHIFSLALISKDSVFIRDN